MLVNFKKVTCLLALVVSLPVSTWAFDNFDCVGSDPFWKLALTHQKFTFTEKTTSTMPSVEPKMAENMNMDHIRIYRTQLNSKDLVVIIQKQSCTDGKSADIFEYEGLVVTSDKVFHGCCSKKILLTK